MMSLVKPFPLHHQGQQQLNKVTREAGEPTPGSGGCLLHSRGVRAEQVRQRDKAHFLDDLFWSKQLVINVDEHEQWLVDTPITDLADTESVI